MRELRLTKIRLLLFKSLKTFLKRKIPFKEQKLSPKNKYKVIMNKSVLKIIETNSQIKNKQYNMYYVKFRMHYLRIKLALEMK